jgi:hypothetical protein
VEPKADFIALGDKNDFIRFSPSLNMAATRIKDKHYRITNTQKNEEVTFVKLLPDKLDFSYNRDFFFLSEKLLAVPLNESIGMYAIVRTKDGSVLCKFSTTSTCVNFVFNTTIFW